LFYFILRCSNFIFLLLFRTFPTHNIYFDIIRTVIILHYRIKDFVGKKGFRKCDQRVLMDWWKWSKCADYGQLNSMDLLAILSKFLWLHFFNYIWTILSFLLIFNYSSFTNYCAFYGYHAWAYFMPYTFVIYLKN
jgi:hypothetical protein